MIAILSPAKNMRPARMAGLVSGKPRFQKQTEKLAALLRECAPWQLESLLRINPEIAMKAFADYQEFDFSRSGSPALLSYYGLAYQNLNAAGFSLEDFVFAQECVRILSAFYGLLRPCDGILPYRLDFQCGVKVNDKSLYSFWGDVLYRELFRKGEPVVNLASAEYSRAVSPYLGVQDRFITCDFRIARRNKLITLPTEAKMCRGRMARYLVQNRLNTPEELKNFCWNGYEFCPSMSTDNRYVFIHL